MTQIRWLAVPVALLLVVAAEMAHGRGCGPQVATPPAATSPCAPDMPPAGTLTSFSMSGRQVHVCWSDGEIDGLADRIQFAGAQQALVLEGKVRLKWRSGGQTAEVSASVVFVHLATGKLEIGASAAAPAAPLPPAPVTGESVPVQIQPVSAETFKFWLGPFR